MVVVGAPEHPCVIVDGPGIRLCWLGVGHVGRVGRGGIAIDR